MRANVFMFNGFIPIYSIMGEMLTADLNGDFWRPRNSLVAATSVAVLNAKFDSLDISTIYS